MKKDEMKFRELPEGIVKVPNSLLADTYLAYQLQAPVNVLKLDVIKQRIKRILN